MNRRTTRVIRDRLVEIAARLLSRRLAGAEKWEDLYDLGLPGLHLAKTQWDGRGEFEPFAIERIRWAMLDELRKQKRGARSMAVAATELSARENGRPYAEVVRVEDPQHEAEISIDDVVDGGGANYHVDLAAADGVEKDADRMRLRRAVKELPTPEDKVMEAYYYKGMTFAEIGKELGMGETTAFECHARAMRRLRKLFGSDGD